MDLALQNSAPDRVNPRWAASYPPAFLGSLLASRECLTGCGGLLEPKPSLAAEACEGNAGLTRRSTRADGPRENSEIFTEDTKKLIHFLADSSTSDSLSLTYDPPLSLA